MNDQLTDAEPATTFQHSTRLPISALNPLREGQTAEHIEATIVLVWPYSSSTKRLSLLLAEKDVRLRKSRGQVRVTFEGECARETAKTHVGIGDTVRLGLQEVSWRETGETVSTPGKKINWDLHIRRKIVLEIRRKNETPLFLNFRAKTPSPLREVVLQRHVSDRGQSTPSSHAASADTGSVLRTPLRVTSGSHLNIHLSPFEIEDDFGSGRKRKRTKYARDSSTWRLVDDDDDDGGERIEPSSPMELSGSSSLALMREKVGKVQTDNHDGLDPSSPTANEDPISARASQPDPAAQDDFSKDSTFRNRRSSITMGPPPVVPLHTAPDAASGTLPPLLPDLAQLIPTSTPVLQPIPSPQLPLVSPFVTQPGETTGYFPTVPAEAENKNLGERSQGLMNFLGADTPAATAATSNFDHTSLVVGGTVSSLPASTIIEEQGTIADDASQARRNILLSQDALSTVPLEAFNNSDIRGLGDAYADVPQGDIDLDALQREIEQNADKELRTTTMGEAVDSAKEYGPSQSNILYDESTAQHDFFGRMMGEHAAIMRDQQEDQQQSEKGQSWKSDQLLVQSYPPAITSDLRGHLVGSSVEYWQVEQSSTNHPVQDDQLSARQSRIDGDAEAFATESSARQNLAHYDGTNTKYEAIDEREDIRRQAAVAEPLQKSPELVEISSDDEDTAQTQPQSNLLQTPGLEAPSTIETSGRRDENLRNRSMSAHDAVVVEQHASAAILDTVGKEQTQSALLTPIATQELNLSFDPNLQTTKDPEDLPITPQPTQHPEEDIVDIQAGNIPQRQRLSEDDPDIRAESPKLPELPTMAEQWQTQPRANRLTRRHFSSDTIGNEYFTPRQSQKVARLDQDQPTDGLQSDAIPSSPLGPRKSSRQKLASQDDALVIQAATEYDTANTTVEAPSSSRGLSTALSYFPRLSTIDEFHGHEVDILAISTMDVTEPTRAKAGPKDFYMTIYLTDQSFKTSTDEKARNEMVIAQVFRPWKHALPTFQRGNVLLLRGMKVQQQNLKQMLLSTDSSGWVVFSMSSDGTLTTKTNGPPVEYGETEAGYVKQLMRWWMDIGEKQYTNQKPQPQANTKPATVDQGSGSSSTQNAPRPHAGTDPKKDTADSVISINRDRSPQPDQKSTAEPKSPRVTRSQRRKDESGTPGSPQPQSTAVLSAPASVIDTNTISQQHDEADDTLGPLPASTIPPATHPVPISPTTSTRSTRTTRSTRNNNNNNENTTTAAAATAAPSSPSRKQRQRNRKKSQSAAHPGGRDKLSSASFNLSEPAYSTTPRIAKATDQTLNQSQGQSQGQGRNENEDVNGNGEEEIDQIQVHELRDGTKYTDTPLMPTTSKNNIQTRGQGHTIGTQAHGRSEEGQGQGQGSKRGQGQGKGHRRTRSRAKSSGNVVHELRDGAKYTD